MHMALATYTFDVTASSSTVTCTLPTAVYMLQETELDNFEVVSQADFQQSWTSGTTYVKKAIRVLFTSDDANASLVLLSNNMEQ